MGQQNKKKKRGKIVKPWRFGIIVVLLIVLIGGGGYFGIRTILAGQDSEQSQPAIETSGDVQNSDGVEVEPLVIEPPKPEPISFTISAAGDCTLGTDDKYGYGGSFKEMYDNRTPDYFMSNVLSIFEEDDLTMVNLEGPLTTSTAKADKTFAFVGEPSYVDILTTGSIEAVTVANNHSYDFGEAGFEETKNVLAEAGVTSFGYEDTPIVDVNGAKVGLVGVYELREGAGIEGEMVTRIHQAKELGAQVVIVQFHWGDEGSYNPNDIQVNLAHKAIDEGADLVIGHHPHVVQGIEKYNGKYIAYSLGNFSFGGNKNPSDKDTMIFQQTFTVTEEGVLDDDQVNIIPCRISSETSRNDFKPTPLEGDAKERVAEKIQEISMTDISGFIQ